MQSKIIEFSDGYSNFCLANFRTNPGYRTIFYDGFKVRSFMPNIYFVVRLNKIDKKYDLHDFSIFYSLTKTATLNDSVYELPFLPSTINFRVCLGYFQRNNHSSVESVFSEIASKFWMSKFKSKIPREWLNAKSLEDIRTTRPIGYDYYESTFIKVFKSFSLPIKNYNPLLDFSGE